ncbi:MAG: hypothetical protein R6V10_00650 [bacterium]
MDTITPAMGDLRVWMIISAVIYAGGGLSFLFGQNLLLERLNRVSELLFKDRLPLIPLSTEKFWLVLTNSMMLMLVVICVFVAADVSAYYPMVWIILFSKAASTLQYTYLFLAEKRYFAYLTGALTDGPLFLVTLILFLRVL